MNNTLQKVQEILVNLLNVNAEQVTPTAHLVNDLHADSLDQVELFMMIDEEFNLTDEVPSTAFETLVTVQAIVDYIDKAEKKTDHAAE